MGMMENKQRFEKVLSLEDMILKRLDAPVSQLDAASGRTPHDTVVLVAPSMFTDNELVFEPSGKEADEALPSSGATVVTPAASDLLKESVAAKDNINARPGEVPKHQSTNKHTFEKRFQSKAIVYQMDAFELSLSGKRLFSLVNSKWFDTVCATVIILNAIVMGIVTQHELARPL